MTWSMRFDASFCKEGIGDGIWIMPPRGDIQIYYFKLYFECSNIVTEYEALVIGLNILRKQRARRLHIFRDSKLIINLIKALYQKKHPRMRAYKNEVLDLFHNLFTEPKISVVSR